MASSARQIDETVILQTFSRYVRVIEKYSGPDPLQPWFEYFSWIERTFSINYKQDEIIDDLLVRCLAKFEHLKHYYQDRRLIKIFIKYILFRAEGPSFYFSQMHSQGVGTKVADLYVNWAFTHLANGDLKSAEKVYNQGIKFGAEPLDILNAEMLSFQIFQSKRAPNDEILLDAASVERRLNRLSALHLNNNEVTAAKYSISVLDEAKLLKVCVPATQDYIVDSNGLDSPTVTGNLNASIVQSIRNSSRKLKRTMHKKLNVTGCRLDFVDEDEPTPLPALKPGENMYELGIQLPRNWARQNRPQTDFSPKPFIDLPRAPDAEYIRKEYHYDKIMLCPVEDKAFSIEELHAYKWFKKRNIENNFTEEQDKIWGNGPDVPIRYPASIFARKNVPQSECNVSRKRDEDDIEDEISKMAFRFSYSHAQHYPEGILEEFSMEELMQQRRLVKAKYEEAKRNGSVVDADELFKITRNPNVAFELNKLEDADRRKTIMIEEEKCDAELFERSPDASVLGNEYNGINAISNSIPPQTLKRKSTDANGLYDLNATCSPQMNNNNSLQASSYSDTLNPAKFQKTSETCDRQADRSIDNRSAVSEAELLSPIANSMANSFNFSEAETSERDLQCNEPLEQATAVITTAESSDEKTLQNESNTSTNSSSQTMSQKSFFQFEYEDENTDQFLWNETRTKDSPQIEPNKSAQLNNQSSQQNKSFVTEFKVPEFIEVKKPIEENVDLDETIGRSIYVQAPDLELDENENDWAEVTAFLTSNQCENEYQTEAVDLNETRIKIDTYLLDWMSLNPFDTEFQLDLLKQCSFLDEISSGNNLKCDTVHIVQPLKPRLTISIAGVSFVVRKIIGSGNFGKVFLGENKVTKECVALKQQRPPNLWEYYICSEVQSRIKMPHVRDAFMAIDYAFVGNNSTIYVSKLSKYGTMLDVCNAVKGKTNKNGLDECIVIIIARQMFSMIRLLHDIKIIHADIKPDNFLLMEKLSTDLDGRRIALQLIDFGQSIDLTQFADNQVFFTKVNTQNFICTEMMNDRPWKYQFDLFCLASTIYTLITGKYMEVSRRTDTDPYKTQKLPRYVNTELWDELFDALINIPSARQIPSLSLLEEKLSSALHGLNKRRVIESINKFNSALDQ